MGYADGTSVPVSRSRVAIEDLLAQWKADRIGVVTEPGSAIVAFSIGQWHVRFKMPLPALADFAELRDSRIRWRPASDAAKQAKLEQSTRERWRALLLTIKAKLVSVENGVETFEEAFLAHLVLPGSGGATVGQRALPAISEAYRTGAPASLQLGPG